MKPLRLNGKPLRRRGGGKLDETFTLDNTGMLNITRIWQFYQRRPDQFDHVEVNITPVIVDIMTRCRDLDPFRLSQMTAEEVDDPANVALAVYARGAFEPIDGNHLITKRAMLGRETFRCVVMPEAMIPRFLIRWEVLEGKRWQPIEAGEILAKIDGQYGQPDGRILDRDGRVLAVVPRPAYQPKSPIG